MIAWWSVTFSSLTTRASGSRSRPVTYSAPLRYSRLRADQLGDRLDLGDHVARQVARVGARVGQRLVLLVAALRRAERAFGGEAVAVVGLALQRRQVVEHRRFLALLFLLELGDLARPALARRRRSPRPRSRGDARLGAGVEAALVGALAVGLEGRVDEPVGLGHERFDLLLAPRDDRERRRLHASERDGAVEGAAQADRRRARGVHADDPVGLRARARGLLEARELIGRAQRCERAPSSPRSSSSSATAGVTGFLPFAFSYR